MDAQKTQLDGLFHLPPYFEFVSILSHSFLSLSTSIPSKLSQGINAMEAQKTRLDELVKKHRLSQIDVFRLLQQGALDAQKQT